MKSIILLPLTCLMIQYSSAQNFTRVEDLAKIDHAQRTNGVAVADYDQDGDLDIFFVGFESFDFSNDTTWNRLLKNNGDATFTDVTMAAGFDAQFVNTDIPAARGEKMGAAWGDYDNDGFPDLFLTNSREDQLYHNEGDPDGSGQVTFIDVTEQAGVIGCHQCYSASGLWWDYDQDGDLDLYVSVVNGFNIMYKNRGDGTFENVTSQLGLGGAGITWTSVAIDANRDGLIDLYNINDTQENQLLVNRGTWFDEFTSPFGLGDEGAGMGVTIGDYNNDGLFDIYITNIFSHHPNPLYTHLPARDYRDDAGAVGVENTGWGWGTHFFDCDHDGDEDLYAVNGVEEKQYIHGDLQTDVNNFFFKSLFVEGDESFVDWSVESATDGSAKARGLEVFDYDEDGDLDLLVSNSQDKPYLYRNETIDDRQSESRNWIRIWLQGTTSNRDALGSEVKVIVDGISYYRWHHGASFLGQSLKPVHFGLASAKTIDEIQVTWPNGLIESIYDVPVNQTIKIIEEGGLTTAVESAGPPLFEVVKSYPNPFSHSTTLYFNLPETGSLDVRIFSLTGQELFRRSQTNYGVDRLEISWDGTNQNGNYVPAGVYFYTMNYKNYRVSGKLLKIE